MTYARLNWTRLDIRWMRGALMYQPANYNSKPIIQEPERVNVCYLFLFAETP
jgi:hypothetical protein